MAPSGSEIRRLLEQAESQRLFPTSEEELESFLVSCPVPAPSVRTRAAYEALTPAKRLLNDEQRIAHFASMAPFPRPHLDDPARQTLRGLLRANRHKGANARVGIALDGPPNSGKTTLAVSLVRWVHSLLLSRHPNGLPSAQLPAGEVRPRYRPEITITLLGEMNPWDLLVMIGQQVGLPPRGFKRSGDYQRALAHLLNLRSVYLIVIDELSALKNTRERDRRVQETLKTLANSVKATFLVAGVDLIESGLLSEGGRPGQTQLTAARSRPGTHSRHHHNTSQTGMRFIAFTVEAFPAETDDDAKTWYQLLTHFERHLILLDQPKGRWLSNPASGLPTYIHKRTGGLVGLVANLLEQALERAISSGTELINETLLEELYLPIDAPFAGLPLGQVRAAPATHTSPAATSVSPPQQGNTAQAPVPADQLYTALKDHAADTARKRTNKKK